jgi:peptidoglycan/LPS O-acetylase OafA/YrhL
VQGTWNNESDWHLFIHLWSLAVAMVHYFPVLCLVYVVLSFANFPNPYFKLKKKVVMQRLFSDHHSHKHGA